MKKMAKQISGIMSQMKAQLANMPPQQRKMMEDMLKKKMPQLNKQVAPKKYVFKKMKSGVKVGKWSTTQYSSTLNGKKQSEFFVSNWRALGLTEDPKPVAIELSKTMEEMLSSLKSSVKHLGGDNSMVSGAKEWMKYGIPVKVISFKNGKATGVNLLKEVKNISHKKGTFLPPKGYSKQKEPNGEYGYGYGWKIILFNHLSAFTSVSSSLFFINMS